MCVYIHIYISNVIMRSYLEGDLVEQREIVVLELLGVFSLYATER